tara:strand:+ start:1198 stop:1680 length:483 start_codon:yes stop_codon:yes gene_type:complete
MMLETFLLLLPAGIANMVPPLFSRVRFLDIPVNEKLFGAHKTYRGFFFGLLFSVVAVYLESVFGYVGYGGNLVVFGLVLGLGALLGDLVESFVKRRLGIKAGKALYVFDQIDWIIGGLIALSFFVDVSVSLVVESLILFGLLHVIVKIIGYLMKINEELI